MERSYLSKTIVISEAQSGETPFSGAIWKVAGAPSGGSTLTGLRVSDDLKSGEKPFHYFGIYMEKLTEINCSPERSSFGTAEIRSGEKPFRQGERPFD